ncbi:MAG: hypothetical protein IJB83_03010 [Bacilli bacterium]|nr:hypothetical protein [Bacilli bacterium]
MYFADLKEACNLFCLITGEDLPLKHFMTKEMQNKISNYEYKMTDRFLQYSKTQLDFWGECFSSYDRIVEENDLFKIYDYSPRRTFYKDEVIEIVTSFYNEFGYYDLVNDFFNRNCIVDDLILGDNALGYTHVLKSLEKYYISLDEMDKGIPYLYVLVHEFGHVLDYKLYNHNTYFDFKTSYMQEVAPIFFQIMFIDYLKRNKIASIEADLLLCNDILVNYDNIGIFEICNNFEIESMNKNGDVICDGAEGVKYKFAFYDTLIYILGFYYAFHLKYLYYNDKNNFNSVFSYFMKNKGEVSSEELSNGFCFGKGIFESGVLIEDYIKEPFINLRKKLIK